MCQKECMFESGVDVFLRFYPGEKMLRFLASQLDLEGNKDEPVSRT